MKFIIHPLLYFLMLIGEIIGIYLLNMYLTKAKSNKKRIFVGTLCFVMVIFLLYVFLFKYHKTLIRSILLFIGIFFYYKFVNQTNIKNTFKQLILTFVSIIMLEVLIQFFVGGLIAEWQWVSDYFSFIYAIYLAFLYMAIALLSITNISIIDVSQT